MFAALDQERYASNESRRQNKKELHAEIEGITQQYPATEVSKVLFESAIPHSPITPIEQVTSLPFVSDTLLKTTTPDGEPVRLPPPPVGTDYLESINGEMPFAPAYGQHTDRVLGEAGLTADEITSLRQEGVVA
jgi:formyl-CoA transferase